MILPAEKPGTPPLEVRLFGGFDVRVEGVPLPALRSRREQWLLALLALRHDRDTAREWLAATLWPDNEETQALFYLRKSLSNLRQALGSQAARLLSPTPRTLRLDLTDAFVDTVAFEAALKRSAASKTPNAEWEEAVGLYRGQLLLDCSEEWAAVERHRYHETYLNALESLGTYLAAQNDPAATVHWMRLLLLADPYRESAANTLMQALSDCGDPAAVKVVYQEWRARLRQDLNTDPSPQTEALYQQLRRREPQTVPAPPAVPAPAAARRHLPVPLSDLIGREEEIRELLEWLPRRRLLTLLGAGGVGKTRLAIAVAESAMPRFEQGVWFVDLAPLSDPARVNQAVARALGIVEEAGRPLIDTLITALEARTLLLVLDNCEHLLETCADLAHALLSACPALCILTTSRQALAVIGEQVYQVPTLPVPPLEEATLEKDPHSLMEYEAIRLFVDRAARVNSLFRLNRRNASVVADICRQLDGIPLAIEMAAARLRSLTVGEIQTRLADRFRLLTSGFRGVLPRQKTLRAAVDWSYDLLTPAEQRALCRLSVFAGGWTREAAEAIAGASEEGTAEATPWEMADLLASLVEKSLVLSREDEEGGFRYGVLETIRQYAWERLEISGERETVRRRQRDYFLMLLKENGAKRSAVERERWFTVLEEEHDNLHLAMTFCLEGTGSGEQGLGFGVMLWRFWLLRGHLSEGRGYLSALLAHPQAQAQTKVRADALNGAGVLAFAQSDYAAARALHLEGLQIYRALEDRQGVAFSLSNMGNVAATLSDFTSARRLYDESLEISRELGNRQSIGNILNNLGNAAMEQGDYDAARPLLEESLEICREDGDRNSLAHSLNNLGIVVEMQGDLAAARALYEESLALNRELGARQAEASTLAGLGNVALQEGDYVAARALYESSLEIRREVGDRWGIASTLNALGAVAGLLGERQAARLLYCRSLEMHQELEDHKGVAASLESLASLAYQENSPVVAAQLWGAASALRKALTTPLPPYREAEVAEEIRLAREAIGAEAFHTAWEEGRTLPPERAVSYALVAFGAESRPVDVQ